MDKRCEIGHVLERVRSAVTSSRPRDTIYDDVTSIISEVIPSDRIGIACLDEERDVFRIEFVRGIQISGWERFSVHPVQGSLTLKAVAQRAPFLRGPRSAGAPAPESISDQALGKAGLQSALAAPVADDGGAHGALILHSARRDAYDSQQAALALEIGELLSGPVANSLLGWRLETSLAESSALVAISRIATSSSDLASVFESVAEEAQSLFHFDRLVVSLVDYSRGELVDSYVWGHEVPGFEAGGRHPFSASLTAEIINSRHGRLLSESDLLKASKMFEPELARTRAGIRSTIFVPISWQEEVIGTLNFHSRIPDAFDQKALVGSRKIADQIAGAVANARAYTDLERESQVNRSLAVLGRAVSENLDLDAVFHSLADEVSNLIPYDRMAVTWFDWERGTGTIAYARGLGEGEGEVGRTYDIYTAQEFGHELSAPDLDPWEWGFKIRSSQPHWTDPKTGESYPLQSWVEVPLGSPRDKPIGFLSLRSCRPDAYSTLDMGLLEQLSAQVTPAIRNAREHENTLTLVREQEGLAEISRLISSSTDTGEVYEAFSEQVNRLIPHERIVIALIDEDEKTVIDAYISGLDVPGREQGGIVPLPGTLTEYVLTVGHGVVVNAESPPDLFREYLTDINVTPRDLSSVLLVPMRTRDRIIGSLHIWSKIPNAYDRRSLAIAEGVSAQIAGAVEISRLHLEARRESAVQKSLAEIGRVASTDLNLSLVFERVSLELSSLIPHDRIAISLIDPESGDLKLGYFGGVLIPGDQLGDVIPPAAGSGWEWRTTSLSHPGSDARRQAILGTGLLSWIEAPLGSENSGVIGYLSLRSKKADAFSHRDLELLGRIAAQVTPAVKNARLFQQTERLVEEQAIVQGLGRTISESLAIEEVFEAFCEALNQVIPADRISIVECEVESDSYLELYNWGVEQPGREVGVRLPLSQTVSSRIISDGSLLIVSRADLDWLVSAYPESRPRGGPRIISSIGVKLEVKGRFLGVLHILSKSENAYTESDLSLAARLAAQIAPAISNAREHAEIVRLEFEQRVLAKIGRILDSTRELSNALDPFASECKKLLPYDRLVIRTVDESNNSMVDEYATGTEVPGFDKGMSHPLEGTVSGHVVSTRQIVVIDETVLPEHLKRFPALKHGANPVLHSMLAVPLISADRIIGVMQFRATPPGLYHDSHRAVAERLASQIAGAVEQDLLRRNLEESEAVYRELYDDAPDMYFSVDPSTGKIMHCNATAVDELGYPRDEIIGTPIVRLYSPGSRKRAREDFDGFKASGEVHGVELVAIRADGSTFDVALDVTSVRDEHGNVLRSRSVLRDISARKRSEAEASIRLAALESAAEMVVITDADGVIEYVNSAFERQTGYSKDEVIGRNPGVLQSRKQDRSFYAEMWNAIRAGRIWSGRIINRRKDGSEYPEERSITPLLDETGTVTRFIEIRRDISERLRAEEAREAAREMEAENRELQRVNEARSEFLSTVSHELRTPLTALLAFSEILRRNRDGNLTDRQLEQLGYISKGGRRLNVLIEDLLDVSRSETGRFELEPAPFDIHELIEEIACSSASLFDQRGQNLEVRGLPGSTWINGDRTRVMQVLHNLLTNAAKYSPDGTPVDLAAMVEDNVLQVTVRDRGIGISREDRENLFVPFFRVDNEETRRESGTGLGLVIVKTIVELHGGRIELESERGAGTTVRVWLPNVLAGPPEQLPAEDDRPVFAHPRFDDVSV